MAQQLVHRSYVKKHVARMLLAAISFAFHCNEGTGS